MTIAPHREDATSGAARSFIAGLAALALVGCSSAPLVPVETDTVAAGFAGVDEECFQPNLGLRASIVRIATDDGSHGSGVVVAQNMVVTAAHVVASAKVLHAGSDETGFSEAHLLGISASDDVALLQVDTHDIPALRLARNGLQVYEDVWAIGYPLAMDMAVVQGRFQREANGKLYTSAWITSGASGGGLLRCRAGEYELVGILRDFVAYVRNGSYVNASQSTSTPAERIRALAAAQGYSL